MILRRAEILSWDACAMTCSTMTWLDRWNKGYCKLWCMKDQYTDPLEYCSQRSWMRAKKLKRQRRPKRLKGPPRSNLAAGVGVLLVGMLYAGQGRTHGAVV